MFRLLIALVTALMLVPITAVPQSEKPAAKRPVDRDVVTRLAYHNTYLIEGQHLSQVCFALYRNGYFQILRNTRQGTREALQGYLDLSEIKPIAGMLQHIDFGKRIGGAVLNGSELFMAEIANDGTLVRHAWFDPDGRRPLPESAVKIVDWLQDFKPHDASPFNPREASFQTVCPRGTLQELPEHVQPASF